jgi:AcrR family transcriptional regulator
MTSRTREESKLATREKLLETGESLLGELGLDAPLDTICERAGFTRGAFYVHFQDRDDFLRAVMDRVGTRFLDSVLGATGDDADLATVAARFVRAVASGRYPLMSKRGVKPHQLFAACVRSRAIRERYVALAQESVDRLARTVERGQRDELLRDDVDPAAIATILLAAIVGAQALRELDMPFDLAATSAALLRMLGPQKRRKR